MLVLYINKFPIKQLILLNLHQVNSELINLIIFNLFINLSKFYLIIESLLFNLIDLLYF